MNLKKTFCFSLLLIAAPAVLSHAEEDSKVKYVQVNGEGEVKIEPDQVVLSFGIENFGPKINDVKNENATRTQVLLDQLKKQKVDSTQIRTDFIQIAPRYDYPNGKRKFVEYSARKNFTVKLDDVANYGKVLQAVIESGVEYVGGIQFQTSKLKENEDEARKRAVADAKKKAEILAGALNQKVGAALFIQENGGGMPEPMLYRAAPMAMKAMAAPVDDQVAPGQLTVTSNVTIRFELK